MITTRCRGLQGEGGWSFLCHLCRAFTSCRQCWCAAPAQQAFRVPLSLLIWSRSAGCTQQAGEQVSQRRAEQCAWPAVSVMQCSWLARALPHRQPQRQSALCPRPLFKALTSFTPSAEASTSSSRHSLPAWLRRPRGNEAVLGLGTGAACAATHRHAHGEERHKPGDSGGTSCCLPPRHPSPCPQWTCTGRGLQQLEGREGISGAGHVAHENEWLRSVLHGTQRPAG